MKFTAKCKMVLSVMVMAFTLLLSNSIAEASTITKKETEVKNTAEIGDTISVSDCKNLKINGKKVSKLKKKIKTVQTSNSPAAFSYTTGSYFNSSSAYATENEYSNAKANNTKYIAYGSYNLKFLKAGTYKVTYDRYSTQNLSMNSVEWDSVNYRYYYQLIVDYDYEHASSERYTRETYAPNGDYVGTYYKSTTTGKIYASTSYYDYDDDDGYYYTSGLVSAVLAKGADGKFHIKYNSPNVIKTTYKRTYKVMATETPVASVTLGKSKQTTKRTSTGYKTTVKSTKKRFLSGNSGKLTVKMSSKNYKLNSIVVETYDKDGNVKYTSVKNKAKIAYGLYKNTSSYQSKYSSYSYSNSSMYKPTIIHIGYTDKFTGEYSKYTVETTNEDGVAVQRIKTTYKEYDDGVLSKEQTSTDYYGPCHKSYTFYKK
jgi:hypothetical protein